MRIPYALFFMLFSTLMPLITDEIDKFSMLTWSTSRYRVLRDLPTFGLAANTGKLLIGKHWKRGLFGDSFSHLPTEMLHCDILEKFQSKTHMYWFVIPRC